MPYGPDRASLLNAITPIITIGHKDSGKTRTLFGDQSLVFVSIEPENTTVAMSSGRLDALSANLSFTHLEFSNSSHDHSIAISDVVLQPRDIVGLSTLTVSRRLLLILIATMRLPSVMWCLACAILWVLTK